jgi:hypothetical protein
MANRSRHAGGEGSEIDTHTGQTVGVEETQGGVELYIRSDGNIVGADLTPAQARKLAAQLIEHADNVQDGQ